MNFQAGPPPAFSVRYSLMNEESLKLELKKSASLLGIDCLGICPLPLDGRLKSILAKTGSVPFVPDPPEVRTDTEDLLLSAVCAVMFLFPYSPPGGEKGNIAAYARGEDYHAVHRDFLSRIIDFLSVRRPDAHFFPFTDTSPLPDRWLAYQAGLGFFGKNHCLIHPKYGSWFTIGGILTTISFPPDHPTAGRCGTCRACMAACPGSALLKDRFLPFRCKSYLTQKKSPLTEEEKAIISRTPLIFGCDECQRVCPFNRSAVSSVSTEAQADRISLLTGKELDRLTNRTFKEKYGNRAFAWRGKTILKRNLEITRHSDLMKAPAEQKISLPAKGKDSQE